jgi:hypothetical protein
MAEPRNPTHYRGRGGNKAAALRRERQKRASAFGKTARRGTRRTEHGSRGVVELTALKGTLSDENT